jgi:signal peptidase I
MKVLKNKDLMRIIINGSCLFLVIIFYLISSLLSLIFNKWIIIISSLIILLLLSLEFLLRNKEKIRKIVIIINEYVQVLLFAILIIEIIFSFIMFPATVSQNSMFPTLLPNDQLIIKRTNDLKNNDIIVFKYDAKIQATQVGVPDEELLIKRIIAIPGQTFEYIGKDLYINGKKANDKFAVEEMNGLNLETICKLNGLEEECLQEDGSYKIPDGWYVVFGDNRQYTASKNPVSIDSRSFGLVHESQIFGVAKYELENIFNWKKIGE